MRKQRRVHARLPGTAVLLYYRLQLCTVMDLVGTATTDLPRFTSLSRETLLTKDSQFIYLGCASWSLFTPRCGS